jgi:hypothetical protein
VTKTTDDIKASKPHDDAFQDLNPPKMVGGQVDILLGKQYLAHFPKLVHSLEHGPGIYEVRLSPASPCVTAAIAGPHHSFNLMMEKVGGVSTMLAAFTQGLNQWKVHGPPPPQHLPLTMEEISLPVSLNMPEMTKLESNSNLDNPLTHPTSQICSTHLSLQRQNTDTISAWISRRLQIQIFLK